MKIEFKILDERLHPHGEFGLPQYATGGSAGLDLVACLDELHSIDPGDRLLVPTGIAVSMPSPDMAALVLPRSGLGHRYGIVLGNLVGLVDSDYQGEIKLSVWNSGWESYTITPGERLGQLIFIPIIRAEFSIVDSFVPSKRGGNGFGSTGK